MKILYVPACKCTYLPTIITRSLNNCETHTKWSNWILLTNLMFRGLRRHTSLCERGKSGLCFYTNLHYPCVVECFDGCSWWRSAGHCHQRQNDWMQGSGLRLGLLIRILFLCKGVQALKKQTDWLVQWHMSGWMMLYCLTLFFPHQHAQLVFTFFPQLLGQNMLLFLKEWNIKIKTEFICNIERSWLIRNSPTNIDQIMKTMK